MRSSALLAMLAWLALSSFARAQVQVAVQTERSDFLLYERVDLLISIENVGGTDLLLDNNEGHPWLSFLVSKSTHLPVRPERDSTFAALTLKAGETKTLRVNLTPLFQFREEGKYTAAAVVDLPGAGQILSASVPFTVLRGTTVWSHQRPVDSSERTYSLIRFSPDADTTRLYLRVEDPAENVVYANISLGDVAAFVPPDVNFDPAGNLHVLQPIAMSTYLYTRASPDGKILDQNIFKTFQEIRPRLQKMDDGSVTVAGGLLQNPSAPRERLSDALTTPKAQPAAAPDSSADHPPDASPDPSPTPPVTDPPVAPPSGAP